VSIRGSLLVYVVILGGLDAAAIAALTQPMRGDGAQSGDATEVASKTEAADRPMDHGFALCLNRFEGAEVTPTTAAITYLDAHVDDDVQATEIRSWFGSVEPRSVDVYKLEQRNGRRRISFEIQRGKWRPWESAAAGLSGRDVCAAVRAALMAANVGRKSTEPGESEPVRKPPAADPTDPDQDESSTVGDRSRFDFEFIYARRPRIYQSVQWVGTLDHALEADTFGELRRWLNRSSR
jgi:hypothetical protein